MLEERLKGLIVDGELQYDHDELKLVETIDAIEKEEEVNFNQLKDQLLESNLIDDMCKAIVKRDMSKAQSFFDALVDSNEANTEQMILFLTSCYLEDDVA
jgi:hypothetical protein